MDNNSIFASKWTDANGIEHDILGMDADHLINALNHVLIKFPQRMLGEAKAALLGEYQPSEMDDRVARTLGLRKPSKSEHDLALERLEELEGEIMRKAIKKALGLMVVGMLREDTREGACKIISEATGISTKVSIPKYENPYDVVAQLPALADEVFDGNIPAEWDDEYEDEEDL